MKAPVGTPMDAFDDDDREACDEDGGEYLCSRPVGHSGIHVATMGPSPQYDYLCSWGREPMTDVDWDAAIEQAQLWDERRDRCTVVSAVERPTVGVFELGGGVVEYRLIIDGIVFDLEMKDHKLDAWSVYDRNTDMMLGRDE